MIGKEKKKKEYDIEDKVVNIQKWIAIALFIILIGLVSFNAFGDKDKSQMMNNSYLPIISGWIGIILGFYFSRELAGIISRKFEEAKKERKQDVVNIEEDYKKFKSETQEIILELLNEIGEKR